MVQTEIHNVIFCHNEKPGLNHDLFSYVAEIVNRIIGMTETLMI